MELNETVELMNFASAFISMTRGHKVARSHWSGY